MKFVKILIIIAGTLYLAALLFVFFNQRNFQYFPQNTMANEQDLQHLGIKKLSIDIAGVGQIDALYKPPQNGEPLIIFFHGNASAAHQSLYDLADLAGETGGFLAVEYPGYSQRPGKPTEAIILATALSAYDKLLAEGIKPKQVFVLGSSLGASAAIYLGANREIAGLALAAPFYSMLAMAKQQMPYFPTRLMLKDKWRSDLWIRNVNAPLLFIHGSDDEIIPPSQSQKLFALAKGKKQYHLLGGGRHDLWNSEMPELVKQFIAEHKQ